MQIKDEKAIIVFIDWSRGIIDANQTLWLSMRWVPDHAGIFTAEFFVWDDLKNPKPPIIS
ncbi:MAG: hypothetical protein QXU32_12760 [Nitrososphaerales archaeon]